MMQRCLACLAILGALGGCTTLFLDDFEAYPSGASVGVIPNPDPDAPGEIEAISGVPALYRVQGGDLVLGFASQGPPDEGPVLSFVSLPPQPVTPQGGSATSGRPVFFTWSGRITAVSDGSFAGVEVREAGEALMFVAVNDVRVVVQRGQTQREIAGDFTAGHRVIIRIDAGGYFAVEVSGDSGGDSVCGGLDGCAFGGLPAPIALPDLEFRMRTFQQVPQGDSYRVEEIRTSQRNF